MKRLGYTGWGFQPDTWTQRIQKGGRDSEKEVPRSVFNIPKGMGNCTVVNNVTSTNFLEDQALAEDIVVW